MVDTDIEVPRNREAEEAVIGSIIQTTAALQQAARYCGPEDFYDPSFTLIWQAAVAIARSERQVEPMAVMQHLTQAGEINRVGGAARLADLMATPWASVNVEYQARTVHEVARARRILQTHLRLGQVLVEQAHDHDALLSGVAREMLNLELLVDERSADAPLDGLMTWPELWNHYPSDTVEWLVPDLLVAEDVFMLLAGEGGGKSWFTRQFCLCLAAGVHPFDSSRRIEPVRSLHVDLENAPAMLAYESRTIGSQVARLGDFNSELAAVWAKEDGINLRDPADARLLERAIADTRPQLVTIGSLYKAFKRGNDDWETAAEETRDVLDRLRRRYHCAFILEHHMPKATGSGAERPASPYGSSTWQKWPSIGLIVHRVGDNMYQLTEFRGTRLAERHMPKGLTRGGALPWAPVYDLTELEFGMWEEYKPKANGRNMRRPNQ